LEREGPWAVDRQDFDPKWGTGGVPFRRCSGALAKLKLSQLQRQPSGFAWQTHDLVEIKPRVAVVRKKPVVVETKPLKLKF
jgi:hypothetical protein